MLLNQLHCLSRRTEPAISRWSRISLQRSLLPTPSSYSTAIKLAEPIQYRYPLGYLLRLRSNPTDTIQKRSKNRNSLLTYPIFVLVEQTLQVKVVSAFSPKVSVDNAEIIQHCHPLISNRINTPRTHFRDRKSLLINPIVELVEQNL